MPRYKLIIEYDVSGFSGWQRQENAPSVQQAIEEAILPITGEAAFIQGAGRTDTGVHALGQVAHVDLTKPHSAKKIREGLNHFLGPQGVAILEVEEVDESFHARFSATYRRYVYRIINRRAPLTLEKGRAWQVSKPLNVERLQAAANQLLGQHDFNSFRSAHCQAKDSVRTIDTFQFEQTGDLITASIQAQSFLHNQVRVMMGTIKAVGTGTRSLEDIQRILKAADRRAAGQTAPAHGLYLAEVGYKVLP